MGDERLELPQGTLDLLILRTLALGPQHGLGMTSRGVALRVAQHPGDFVDPILPVQDLDVAGGNASAGFLRDHQMIVGPSGNLGKMGDH